jgi:glyoxylase-like metal-dependent hydrolase (beta-lactamase superfamily II)
MMGMGIEGITRLLESVAVPIHVQADEAPWVTRVTGVGVDALVTHSGGDVVSVGEVPVTLVHTPGHTPGSQCFLVDGRLLAGDTLFLDGCGRTDLPGGDPEQMYESLTTRLARVPDDTLLFPGHFYSAEPSATLGRTRRSNMVFQLSGVEQWLSVFARS